MQIKGAQERKKSHTWEEYYQLNNNVIVPGHSGNPKHTHMYLLAITSMRSTVHTHAGTI